MSGDATREETLAVAEHLRSCPDCQHELDAAVVAHAALTSARRFAAEIGARPVPRDNAVGELQTDAPVRTGRRRRVVLGVAAAAVVATGVGISIAGLPGTDAGTAPRLSRSIALAAYDAGTQPARVTMASADTLRIDATALPVLDRHQFYEVWLTDPTRTHLQAVGSLDVGNRAVLTVSPNVMARYTAIEVSIQDVSQTSFSGTSVLRGSYH